MSIEFQALSNAVYSSKYQLTDKDGNKVDKDRFDTFKRVAKALAQFEKDPAYWEPEFYKALCYGAVPAGRITSNAGAGEHKPNTSLINCIVSDTIYDSISGIGQAVKDSLISLSTGSGIGYCFSTLRPKGSYVSGVGACFTEDTEILDVNCNSISFKDLEQKLKSEEVYTFSAYPDGSLKVSKILKCWVTKQAKTYVKVTLDTGEIIKCTTDHKFLLRSGEYISAMNLIPNMSLMPLYHKTMARHNDKNLRNYVLDNSSGKYIPVYKLSSRRKECESAQIHDAVKMCVHHKDFNSLNDAPTNLEFMSESDHFRLHTLVRNADPVFQAHAATTAKERANKLWEKFKTNPEAFAEWQRKQVASRNNPEWKQKQSLVARRTICSKTVIEKRTQKHKEYIQQNREIFNEEQNRRALKGQETRINSVITELKQRGMELTSSNFDQIGLSKSNGCGISFKKAMKVRPDLLIDFVNNRIDPYSRSEKRCETCINKVLTELKLRNLGKTISSFIQIMEELYDPAYLNWSMIKHHFPDFPSLLSEYNHTVQKVELCTSENLLDFYDLEVDTSLHNFPLACGVFVHNSTSGPLPFAEIFDKGCFTIASAGGRRGAQMATFDVRHPDIVDFIKVKREDGRFRQFNISALIPNEFFNEEKTWQFRFPLRQTDPFTDPSKTMWDYWHVNDEHYTKNEEGLTLFKKYGEIDKEELWNLILRSNYDFAEPGILFIDKINRENNLWFCEDIVATNPCITGDTRIAVAGQGAIAIKDLAETGMDVPVFCQNLKTGAIEVSMGRNPRKTGEKQKVYKVVLDDGSSFKTTENHGLYLRNGTKVKVSELTVGDSLLPFHQRVNHVPDTYVKSIGQWVKEQHLLLNYKDNTLYNFGTGRGKYHAHHIDGDHTNNTLSNLQALLHEEHNSLHLTQKNPMQVLLSKGYELTKDTWDSLKEVLHKRGIKPTISSDKIVDYWDGDWSKFVCDCEDFNHKVLNVEFVGYEDVYNITVDKHHNYFIVTNEFEKNGNSHYSGILSQNCGEQPLPPNGACLLGSIDLTRFVSDPFTDAAKFDYDLFTVVIETFTRMLDNVVELNNLPLPAQQEEIYRKRRHGMGFFGLGSTLTMLGIPYNSKQALEFGEDIAIRMALTGFVTGVELAQEKGPAPIMNESFVITPEMARLNDFAKQHIGETFTGKELFLQSDYMQRLIRLKPSLEDTILIYGCRFTHHSSIAPTGTISLAMGNNASGGVEPSFAHQYFRNVTTEGKKTRQQESVYSKEFLVYKNLPINQGKSDEELLADLPDYFVTADSIHWKAHVNMLAAIQPWVDSSISKTINLPSDISFDEFKDVYQYAYSVGCKAVSTYRYNPETLGSILSRTSDLEKSRYEFTLDDGTVIKCKGNDQITYDGESTTAENLFNALKEKTYGKF